MKLRIFKNDPANNDPIVAQTENFLEPFLPNTGDIIVLLNGSTVTVAQRRFSFAAGSPNVEAVDLLVN